MTTYTNPMCIFTGVRFCNNNDESYINYAPYKLHDWVDVSKLDIKLLAQNPYAIDYIDVFMNSIPDLDIWSNLSNNPNGTRILEKYIDKINWDSMSMNPNAIDLIEKNLDKVNWNI